MYQLSFSLGGLHLVIDLGSITLRQFPLLPTQTPSRSAYGIQGDESWVIWNGNKALWPPLEYQPSCSIIRNQTITIGCVSDLVFLI